MYLPKAYTHRAKFEAAIARASKRLAPNVVKIIPTFDNDWTGEPSVFLMVILSDEATSTGDQLLSAANHVSHFIFQELEPMEKWGVYPYFDFRSKSEQEKLEPSLA